MPLKMLTRSGFTGGIKPAYAAHALPEGALWFAHNIDADEVGVLSVRPGAEAVAASLGSGAVTGLTNAFDTLVCVWNKALYKLVSGAWTALRTNFLPSDTWANMVRWEYDDQEVLYIHAGQGIWRATEYGVAMVDPYEPESGEQSNLLLASGGGQDPDADVFKSTIGVLRPGLSSRMAAAYGNAVYLSDPDDPSYWPANQYITLPDDGGTITGLALWRGALVVFRDKDIWAVFGSDWSDTTATTVVLQDSSTGCTSPRSIASVPGVGLVFLGNDNVYALQAVSGIEDQLEARPIGDDIKPYLAAAIADGVDDVCATYHDGQYHLSFPSAVQPERIFRLRTNPTAWYCDTGPKTAGYAVLDGDLYSADPAVGLVYERTGYTDNGSRIPWRVAFPHEALSAGPARIKRLFLYLNATNTAQHIDATVISDGREMDSVEFAIEGAAGPQMEMGDGAIEFASIGRTSEVKVYEGKVAGLKGNFAQVQVNGNTSGEDLRIIGYALSFRPRSRAKGIRTGVTRYDNA